MSAELSASYLRICGSLPFRSVQGFLHTVRSKYLTCRPFAMRSSHRCHQSLPPLACFYLDDLVWCLSMCLELECHGNCH